VHWKQLPIALVPDEPYDKGGVWSGSTTLLYDTPGFQNSTPVISYSTSSSQLFCLAVPKNRSDPELIEWVKLTENPVFSVELGRDPTSAWRSVDSDWLMAYGSGSPPGGPQGSAPVYKSKDFVHWERAGTTLYESSVTGFWNCPDFFPISNPTPRECTCLSSEIDTFLFVIMSNFYFQNTPT
jgi:beta-fructofuranosidase